MKGFLTLIAASVMSCSAYAETYYNCATNTGCVPAGAITAKSTYAKTKYPIVLAHGMGAFNSIGPVSSWYAIPENLAQNGATVYSTKVSTINSSDARGEQLLTQVKQIAALTPTGKVNLIGHSHGGQSVRYVLGVAPQYVASVTTIASPHKGTPIADVLLGTLAADRSKLLTPVAATALNGFGLLVSLLSGGGSYPQDSLVGFESISSKGSAEFNARFPAGVPKTACGSGVAQNNGVRFYSWSGGKQLTNPVDASDAALAATSLVFSGDVNDGLVGSCSSHFGQVIRDNYRMNHLDEINQLFGLVSLFETNPVSVFRQHANRLKNTGL